MISDRQSGKTGFHQGDPRSRIGQAAGNAHQRQLSWVMPLLDAQRRSEAALLAAALADPQSEGSRRAASALLARHQDRPYPLDYVQRLMTDFEEIHGEGSWMETFEIMNQVTVEMTEELRELIPELGGSAD